MTLTAIISQAFLALCGGALMLLPAYTDERLALMFLALALGGLMMLLENSRWLWLPMLSFSLASLVWPSLVVFWPLALYICLFRAPLPAVIGLAALSLIHGASMLQPMSLMLLALAPMLKWKDQEQDGLRKRLLHQRDESTELALAQQSELAALQRAQETGVKLAIIEERNRIARDIHDNVGHILGRSILQVTAMALAAQDEAQQAAFGQLRDSLTSGMNAVRHSVHNTRQDALHLDQEIAALIAGFSFCPVTYSNQAVHEMALNKKYVIMAAIKEALNNVMRHSNASHVEIRLSEAGGSHVLIIRDNGSKRPPATGGLGLSAMDERIRGLGGSLHLSRENGFRILIRLPLED